jgi:hypothetical protein
MALALPARVGSPALVGPKDGTRNAWKNLPQETIRRFGAQDAEPRAAGSLENTALSVQPGADGWTWETGSAKHIGSPGHCAPETSRASTNFPRDQNSIEPKGPKGCNGKTSMSVGLEANGEVLAPPQG